MSKFYTAIIGFLIFLGFSTALFGQQILVTDARKKELADFSVQLKTRYQTNRQLAFTLAKGHGWPIILKTKNGGIKSLQGVNSLGFPIYLKTDNNTIAAATTGTNTVQPGGSLGLSLSGSSTLLNNKLAIWDGGSVLKAHQEFRGKTITLHDSSQVIDHATHVSGTMIAKGAYAPAKGMAFNAATLQSYDFDNDVGEMSAAASGLLLSNHSYGDEAGWNFNDAENHWEWYGLPGDSLDYSFGFYGTRTRDWDRIAYNAPYYLIVESAGNSRGDTGPAVGTDYYGYESVKNQVFVDKGPRPANISSNNGYGIISTTGNAKNILTVGAINPLPFGPVNSSDISIAYFSSWGPTDDGRVKPDIVGDGVDVLSAGSAGNSSYITLSGTSMSSPNVTGSLYLLQEYYAKKNSGNFMKAATLKGLACHTAFDAGNVGPDYIYGWGLLDMKKAAQAITSNNDKSLIKENTLQQGQTQTYNVTTSGDGPLMATISWTDPAADPTPEGKSNVRTPRLINDLDIRISDGTTTFTPWVLDPAHPSVAAKNGDNKLDNVEQVLIPNAALGKNYTITVSHKGTLQSGAQDYSLIVTGVGGHAYCASAPLSNADSRVNKIVLSNLNYTLPAGCTTYSDHTDLTAQLEQGKTYPLSLTLGTCGANFNKAAKIYIDWNGNGVFDNNELVATTNVISNTATYATNVMVPATVIPGNFSIMRVVLTETGDTSVIKPCGSYAKGETQDYRVQFLQTSTDVGVVAIVSPGATGSCSQATQITVTLQNFGTKTVSDIPVKVTITNAGNVVTTLNQIYASSIAPQQQENFTLNSSFNAAAGSTYTIAAETALAADPVSSNNKVSQTVTISLPPVVSNLTAFYCTNTSQYQLSGSGDGELLWYQNAADAVPIAVGSPALTTQPPVNNTYYAGLNDFKGSIGPATKNVFSGGGYNQFTPYVSVNTKLPVVIESARLYIGNSGKITFNVSDANGQIVSSTTINAVATRSNPQPGVLPDDPNDQGAVYDLNLLLPAAGDYTIAAQYEDANVTLFRNNAGVKGYPFKIGNIFSITGNGASADSATQKGFYYYFYDIKLKSAGCASATREPVTLKKPEITQNGTVLSSNFATGNQWYVEGKAIAGASSNTYTPTQTGIYQVGINLDSGCQSLSNTFIYVLTNGGQGTNGDIGLVLYPVPANDKLSIIFAAKSSGELKISFINAAGKIAYSTSQTVATGNFSTILSVATLPPGTYVLKMVLGDKEYDNKIVIVR